jgi:rRNA maturation endonuclease Nob1
MQENNDREIKLTWELTCRQCKASFEVPVPRGPREEKELKCTKCGSEYIERIEASTPSVPPCGG